MRIEFLTDDNPIYVLPFFEEFVRNYAAKFEIIHVSSCRPMGKRSRRKLVQELSCLYGPIGIARLGARWATARLLGNLPRGRNASKFQTLKQLCMAYGIPYDSIGSPNEAPLVAALKQRAPDLLVSIACPYILKEAVLTAPRLGCINMHHAPLPKYKGMMPTFWQMFQGERKVGLTIHTMDVKIDEGKALLQDEMEIEPGESLDRLIRRSKRHGAHCMAKVLSQVENQTQATIKLDNSQASYFTFPTIEQIREFRRRGLRAI
jgi:methionyl-tRNA formyltransferase